MKKSLAILFAVVLAVCMCVPSLALTLDTAESAAEATVIPADASLQADIVPGLNVINGKAAFETFEDYEAGAAATNISGGTVTADKALNGTKAYAVTNKSGSEYNSINFSSLVSETGRPYYVHASSIEPTNDAENDNDFIWWIMQTGASSNAVYLTVPNFATNSLAGNWTTYESSLPAKADNAFYFQMKGTKSYAHTIYFDDLAWVPYYKISYSGIDTVEYVLFADESDKDLSKLMTTYTVKTDNLPEDQVINGVYSKCIGWATTEGATEPVTSVTLANADVTLYPVWVEGDFITTDGTYMLGKTGTTYTVTAIEPVDWTYDVNDTKATVTTTETTLTITAGGYAGYVNYSATSKTDATKTVSVELRLIGGDYYRPGINLWTGTEDAYGFEDVDTSIVSGSAPVIRDKELVSIGSMSIAKKAKVDDAENMAVYFSGNYPHITTKLGTMPVIEADRPVFVSYNKMGTKNASYRIIRNALNSDDTKVRLRVDGISEYLADWEYYYTTVTGTSIAASNIASVGYVDDTQDIKNFVFMKASGVMDAWLDDVMIAPYYMITYCDADGVPVATEYVLIDENGNFLDYYIPDNSKVTGATGFALEQGGEKVVKVALNNEDITLYVIKDDIVTYENNGTVINAAVEGETFTFPAAADVFEGGVSNFRAWYVDGVNYYPGDEVASSEVIGKVIEAVAFSAKLYDPAKGILVAYADFEQVGAVENTFAYVNATYTTGISKINSENGVTTRAVEAVDGEHALRLKNKADASYRFGYYSAKIDEDANYTISVSSKAITPNGTGTDTVALNNRFRQTGGFIRINSGKSDLHFDAFLTTSWQTFVKSQEHTSFGGFGVNVFPASYTNNNNTPDDTSDDLTRYHKTDFYLDDIYVYCYPKNLVMFRASVTTEDYVEHRAEDIEGTYTFPNPLELGLEIPYFVAWTDGENKYEVGEEVTFTDVQYKNFYAYAQDPTTPAMGYAFEGGSVPTLNKAAYGEQMEDDGRSVLHIHQWGTTWNSKAYATDTRAHILSGGFDAGIYNVVEYNAKVENAAKALVAKKPAEMTAEDYEAVDETEVRIFYYTYNGTGLNFWGNGGGEYLVGNGPFTMKADGNYYVNTFDMGVKANGNSAFPWIGAVDGKIYGFAVDPNKSGTFSGDIYIDYLRVYKGGDTTVTYDTNAPEGAAVLTEVDADTGRGVGTGYLLTGKRPAVEGYIFKGWATSADSTETVIAIDLTGDTTVYAVWEAADAVKAPASTTEYAIRGTGDNNGLRFKATIKNSEMTGLDEFGFIATRESILGENDLTFAFKKDGANEKLYVSGVAYNKADGTNMINGEETDGSIIYTAVATGIPVDAKNEKMVMRTYAKYHINNMDVVLYGGIMKASLYDVALAIKNENGTAYANNKEYIDSILAEEA